MTIRSERRRSSRAAESLGTVLVYLGIVGILASITLTIWALRDLSRQVSEIGATFKIELVAAVGITPTLLSLLVIAAGIHLQTRATELLLPRAIADGDRNDLNDDPVPRVE